jgi:hypothetical protein
MRGVPKYKMRPYLKLKKYNRYPHYLTLFVTMMLLLFVAPSVSAYDVVLGWDPNKENDLDGYVLYVDDGGSNSHFTYYEYVDTYPLKDIDEDNPACQITGLEEDQPYYFVVTAYNTEGIESDFSEEICVMNGQACASRSLSAGSSGGGSGGGGSGCFIESSHIGNTALNVPSIELLLISLLCLMILVIFRLKIQRP